MKKNIFFILLAVACFGCGESKIEEAGFSTSAQQAEQDAGPIEGFRGDTLRLQTRPRNVLLTSDPAHRLVPIYKVNFHKRTKKPFVGSNSFYSSYWSYGRTDGNNWNNNFMPGFEAMYGYNFVNVSHYNNRTQQANAFFDKPVLIRTLYYPAFSKDTLNGTSITRQYYMVSAHDEDSNKDGFVNSKDLRRFYHFDLDANNKTPLVPQQYSVMSSEYDPQNDYMYVFARLDENANGQMESEEAISVFWIDLKDPSKKGMQYDGSQN
ncbi:MAG: hypothetical protein AAFV95_02805 [Bacteroidota bacterium]